MKNFSSEFQTPEQYIIDITYRIWEEGGVGRIRDWYAPDTPVYSPHGVTNSVETIIRHTLEAMHQFPREGLLAEDVIIGDRSPGFLSSHRVRSNAMHQGDGYFGRATNRPVTLLSIADCLCRDNRVVEEWLVGDQASIALQLGLDPVKYGKETGANNPDAYTIGNEAMRKRWSDPNGLMIVGEQTIADQIIDTYDSMWNSKNLQIIDERYDRAVRLEGPMGQLCYGRVRTRNVVNSFLSSIPVGRFEPHHVIVRQQSARAIRVALRWSYCGTHSGSGRYGNPTNTPLALLGISHFELRDGLIANEWMVLDETAVYAQMAAYQLV